jgi:hypothetical protein
MSLQDHTTVANPQPRPSGALDHTNPEALATRIANPVIHVKRYEQTFIATQPRAYRALVRTVQLLRYSGAVNDPETVQVRFMLFGRSITGKGLSESPGRSTVVVEVTAMGGGAVGATALFGEAGLIAAGGGVSLRAMEQRFARVFLDNVQRVLEGREPIEDASLPAGIERRQNRGREV